MAGGEIQPYFKILEHMDIWDDPQQERSPPSQARLQVPVRKNQQYNAFQQYH